MILMLSHDIANLLVVIPFPLFSLCHPAFPRPSTSFSSVLTVVLQRLLMVKTLYVPVIVKWWLRSLSSGCSCNINFLDSIVFRIICPRLLRLLLSYPVDDNAGPLLMSLIPDSSQWVRQYHLVSHLNATAAVIRFPTIVQMNASIHLAIYPFNPFLHLLSLISLMDCQCYHTAKMCHAEVAH